MDNGTTSFREVLRSELTRRRSANRRYSLRGFARALRIDHSTLSQLVRGRRALTDALIRRLGSGLQLESLDIERHCQEAHDRAILQIIRRRGFRTDSRWIATVTGMSADQVNVALQRLLHRGALVMSSSTQWETVKELDGKLSGAMADRHPRSGESRDVLFETVRLEG